MILKHKNGFTLIEILVALGIIGIIAVILSSTITATLKAKSASHERLQVLALCTSSMDEIKANQEAFTNLSDIEAWLLANGYEKQAGFYKKNDADTGIAIEVYLNQDLNINGLFEIKLIGKSAKTSEFSISTVIKGGT